MSIIISFNEEMKDIAEQIDSFEYNRISWIVDTFQTLDFKAATYAQRD